MDLDSMLVYVHYNLGRWGLCIQDVVATEHAVLYHHLKNCSDILIKQALSSDTVKIDASMVSSQGNCSWTTDVSTVH